jgi:leucyl aminopeptidase
MDVVFRAAADFTGIVVAFTGQTDGALALPVPTRRLPGPLRRRIGEIAGAGGHAGAAGTVSVIIAPTATCPALVLAGLGDLAAADGAALERAAAAAVKAALTLGPDTISFALAGWKRLEAQAGRIGLGARLAAYRFDGYRTKLKDDLKPKLKRAIIDLPEAQSAWDGHSAVADGVTLARDLVMEPANVLTPPQFAARLKGLSKLGVKVTVLGEKEMAKLGMNALLGVGLGSQYESQLVVMEWKGGGDEAPLALVGKGVCFDTGGISIKPAGGMEEMKGDMGGAAAVSGAMMALAKRNAKANVIGVVGLVENMPDGKAQRPGDIVTSMSGQTIEVLNTDAEGRLVLCDAMTWVQETHGPKAMIDLATLTGAIIISLGSEYAGLFSNSDGLSAQIERAGKATGEPVWRLPLAPAYDKLLNSPVADMKNVQRSGPGAGAGSITAAQFLQRFVKDGVDWAHIDIAGTAWKTGNEDPRDPVWGTGYGVRLLDRLVADSFER